MSRVFPIMPGTSAHAEVRAAGGSLIVVAIPWEFIAPHEAQAESNHKQSLRVLASRGGLSPCEAIAVLEDRPWRQMDNGHAHGILHAKRTLWAERELAKLDARPSNEGEKSGGR